MIKKLTVFMVLIMLLITGCTATKEDIVAKVNGKAISKEVYERRLQDALSYYKQGGMDFQGEDGKQSLDKVEKAVLQQIIDVEVFLHGAADQGYSISDKELEAEFLRQQKGFANIEEFNRAIEVEFGDEENFRQILSIRLLQDKVFAGLTEKITISEGEVAKYYQDNKRDYGQVELWSLLVKEEKEAQKIKDQLAAGVDFGALASEYSQDQLTKEKKGYLGWVTSKQLVEEVAVAAFEGPLNQITIIKVDFGYQIIKPSDRKFSNLEEVAEDIKALLIKEKEDSALQDFFNQYKEKAEIEVF